MDTNRLSVVVVAALLAVAVARFAVSDPAYGVPPLVVLAVVALLCRRARGRRRSGRGAAS